MSPILFCVIVVVVSYLVGGIPFGFVIGKMNGVDIRKLGSGNIGATNVMRSIGKPQGIACFALDFLKGLFPVLAAAHFAAAHAPGALTMAPLLAVFGTVAGHIFTPYLHFKGGKGVATSAGAVMGIAWLPVLIAFAAWYLTLRISRYVGLASVAAAIVLPLSAGLLMLTDWRVAQGITWPVMTLLIVLGAMTVYRHIGNLQRIMAGTEPKSNAPLNKATDPATKDSHATSANPESAPASHEHRSS